MPVGGAFAGLALGCLVALLLERMNGRVRSASEVLAAGLPVLASVRHSGRRPHVFTRSRTNDFDNTIRRLRAHVLRLDPRPDIISVAPSGDGRSDSLVPDSLAASFARAGHRVVLVRTDGHAVAGNLAIEVDGLAEALLHERLSVLDLLQPSVEPLLSLLPPGRVTAQTRELIDADRLRAVLAPLVEVGHIVVIDSPGAGGVEGEAVVGAADLGLIVVTAGRSRLKDLEPTTAQPARRGSILAGVVIGRRSRLHRAMSGTGFGRLHQGDGGIDDQILAHGASQEQSASAAR
jgi:Mrp family chromosome partitioning ATPase